MQLIPAWLWQTNPAPQSQPKWDSPQMQALTQRACFDCHSNQTTWPWYSYIAPASWLITRDVIAGRRALNFDDWQTSLARGDRFPLDQQVQREVSRGDMPPAVRRHDQRIDRLARRPSGQYRRNRADHNRCAARAGDVAGHPAVGALAGALPAADKPHAALL
ncbi:MAG: heme-binding domain-containing protein [Roseiflexaceae bacterium]